LNDLAQGLQLAEVLGHPVPLVGLGDGAITREHGKRCGSVVSQKESYFLPLVQGFGHGEVEVRIDAMPGLGVDNHASQNCHFHVRALRETDVKEVVP
jgi:hypothetical protein